MKCAQNINLMLGHNSEIAIKWENRQVTYAELSNRVTEVSKTVRNLPQPIFINLPKSDSQLVWLMACLETQTAFCILDSSNIQRNTSIKSQVPYGSWVSENSHIEQRKEKRMPGQYIVFTSGTTGTPKGVVCYQKTLIEVIEAQASKLGKIGKTGWYLNSAFDASLSDILLPLLTGGTLFIPNFPATNIKKLRSHLIENSIEYTDLPPRFLEILSPFDFPKLRTLLVGGEPTTTKAAEKWRHNLALWNSYGPTEATVSTSMCQISRQWNHPWLGTPLNGVEYKVVDSELLIAGHLAKGYLGQEELTSTKFKVVDGKLYYHTGDIIAEDQGIYYVGRKDRQMKVNGVLICPEEIEKYLAPIECVVFKHENKMVIATTNKLLTAKRISLSSFPKGKIIELSKLPRTASGKPDITRIRERILEYIA